MLMNLNELNHFSFFVFLNRFFFKFLFEVQSQDIFVMSQQQNNDVMEQSDCLLVRKYLC